MCVKVIQGEKFQVPIKAGLYIDKYSILNEVFHASMIEYIKLITSKIQQSGTTSENIPTHRFCGKTKHNL